MELTSKTFFSNTRADRATMMLPKESVRNNRVRGRLQREKSYDDGREKVNVRPIEVCKCEYELVRESAACEFC